MSTCRNAINHGSDDNNKDKNIRLLTKLGSGELTPTIGETKVITSYQFCKMSID